MESIIFRMFQAIFKLVVILAMTGALVGVLKDLQRLAFDSKRVGLTSMLKVNQQLVGRTKL